MKLRTTISIEEQVHQLGKAIARQDRRDFSGTLEVLIEEEAARRKINFESGPTELPKDPDKEQAA